MPRPPRPLPAAAAAEDRHGNLLQWGGRELRYSKVEGRAEMGEGEGKSRRGRAKERERKRERERERKRERERDKT